MNIIISDKRLVVIVKNADTLTNDDSMLKFLKPWGGVKKHHIKLLACLLTAINTQDLVFLPQQSDQKTALVITRASKKMIYINNPVITKVTMITAL